MRASCRSSAGAAALMALLLGSAPHVAASPLEVARGEDGWTVKASGVQLEEVLGALAEHESFAVVMQPAVERPLVDVDVRAASLEDVLRRVLHGRSYTIGYRADGDALAVSRVEVLLPVPPRDERPAVGAVPPLAEVPPAIVPHPETDDARTARRVAEAQRRREQQLYARLRQQQQRVQPGEVAAATPPAQQDAGDERVSSSRRLWNQIWSTRGDPRARP
jgi:hypothetical protein